MVYIKFNDKVLMEMMIKCKEKTTCKNCFMQDTCDIMTNYNRRLWGTKLSDIKLNVHNYFNRNR